MKKLTQEQENTVADLAYNRRNAIVKVLAEARAEGKRTHKAQVKLYAAELDALDAILAAITVR